MCTGLVCKLHNWPADSFKFLMIFGSVLQSNNKAIGVRSNKIWIQRKQAMIWFALTVYLFFFHAIVAVGSQLPCPSTVSVQIEVMDQNSATNSSSKFLAAEGKSLDRWVLWQHTDTGSNHSSNRCRSTHWFTAKNHCFNRCVLVLQAKIKDLGSRVKTIPSEAAHWTLWKPSSSTATSTGSSTPKRLTGSLDSLHSAST